MLLHRAMTGGPASRVSWPSASETCHPGPGHSGKETAAPDLLLTYVRIPQLQSQDYPEAAFTVPRLDFTGGALTVHAGHFPPGPRLHRLALPPQPAPPDTALVYRKAWEPMGHHPLLPPHGWALKLEDFRGGGGLGVKRSEALGPAEILERSSERITQMPLTRSTLHRELHHEPSYICPIPTQLCFVGLCELRVPGRSRHAFEARVSTEIKIYFSHSNKVCPYPLGAFEGVGLRRGSLTPVPTLHHPRFNPDPHFPGAQGSTHKALPLAEPGLPVFPSVLPSRVSLSFCMRFPVPGVICLA